VGRACEGLADRVVAIGLSGQMHGLVMARSDGTPLRPAMLWLDRRAEDSRAAYEGLDAGARRALGNPFIPGMAGPMLHWLALNEPAVTAGSDLALQPKDWLRLRLVGGAGTEPSDASGTLLFDLFQGDWAMNVADQLGVGRRLLAPMGQSGSPAGGLTAWAAGELGLRPGIPVAFGAGDTAAGLVGTGLEEAGPVQLTVGTGAQVVTVRLSPEPDPGLRYHVFAAAQEKRWYALGAVQAAGAAFTWAWGALGASWYDAYQLLGRSPLGAKGALFVPHLAGARSPSMDYNAKAGFFGLQLVHERADMVRAVFEGVAFSIAEAAYCLPEFTGAPSVLLAGGGSTRPEWRQLLADVLGKHLTVLESPNASPRGAALLGARAIDAFHDIPRALPVHGEVEPDAAAHGVLADAFARWREHADGN
jgi:xylulokinase